MEKGANVNHIKTDQTTPLMIATRKSNSEVVSMLLRLGADANILRNDGIGSLYISCWLSNSVITRILLDEGKVMFLFFFASTRKKKKNTQRTGEHNLSFFFSFTKKRPIQMSYLSLVLQPLLLCTSLRLETNSK